MIPRSSAARRFHLNNKPKGNGWIKWSYNKKCGFANGCGFINEYFGKDGNIKILDGDNIFFSIKDTSPDQQYFSNYDIFIIDTTTNRVMWVDFDS